MHMHYHIFCPAPNIRAKITFQKYILGSNPEIPFPPPVLTYHFLVPIGALEYCSDFCPKNWPKIDHFLLNFKFHPSLLIRFSDPEIPIVHIVLFSRSSLVASEFISSKNLYNRWDKWPRKALSISIQMEQK